MKRLYLLVTLTITINTFACDCPVYDFETQYKSSPIIFTGFVDKKNLQSRTVQFITKKFWKGSNKKTITLHMKNSMCDFQFEKGKTYLVFTTHSVPNYASICGRTSLIEKAGSDLEKLKLK